MKSTVQIRIQFNGKYITLPINPEEITIDQSAENTDLDIIGLGKTTRKGEPSLKSVSIESFFPAQGSYFYTGVKPKTCVNFINEIWHAENTNNNVAKITTIGLPINLNMYFVINNFTPKIKAGEEEDIYYTLDIKEYRPYGVKTINVQLSGLASTRANSPAKKAPISKKQVVQKTYKVVSGDCLWNITKKFTGNGAKWKALYNLNKSVIGRNPDLIYPGQVLTLPNGW